MAISRKVCIYPWVQSWALSIKVFFKWKMLLWILYLMNLTWCALLQKVAYFLWDWPGSNFFITTLQMPQMPISGQDPINHHWRTLGALGALGALIYNSGANRRRLRPSPPPPLQQASKHSICFNTPLIRAGHFWYFFIFSTLLLKIIFCIFIKLIWLGVGFSNRTGAEIGY